MRRRSAFGLRGRCSPRLRLLVLLGRQLSLLLLPIAAAAAAAKLMVTPLRRVDGQLAATRRRLFLQRLVVDAGRVLAPRLLHTLLQLVGQRLTASLLQQQLMRRPIHLLPRHVQRLLHLARRIPHEVRVAVLAETLLRQDL